MQRREDPVVTQRQTEIVTIWPGATTEDVEHLVTRKIDDNIQGVTHVLHVQGDSRPGISVINVTLDDEMTDAAPVLQDIRNHLSDIKPNLPQTIRGPALVDDIWKTYPIILGISAKGYSPRAIYDFAKQISEGIGALPDVGFVKIVGEHKQEVHADLDLRRIAQYGLTANEVIGALQSRNALVPNGAIEVGGRLAQIDTSDPLHNADDVADTAITAPDGRIVRVGDVADVETGYQDPPSEIVQIDGRPGIALAIQVKETSSVTSLGPEINDFLDRTRATWPDGMRIAFLANQPITVKQRIDDFAFNLLLALIIVTGLVALFMGLRNGLLVGATVAFSILLTLGLMSLFDADFNQISLLALIVSLGIVVDAGIVAIDNIELCLRNGLNRQIAAWKGVQDLWFPLLTSTLVAIFSFLPFRFMGGSIGDFLRDLSIVTTLALASSLVVAYVITPILGEWFAVSTTNDPAHSHGVAHRFEQALHAMQRAYVPIATASLRRPLLTVGIAVLAILLAIAWIPRLGIQFFPQADRSQFFIDVNTPDGTSITRTVSVVAQVERILDTKHGITHYAAFVGQGAPRFYYNILAEQPKPSYAQMLVDTADVATANALVEQLQPVMDHSIPGARIDVKRLEQGPPVGDPIQIRLTGAPTTVLEAFSAKLQDVLRRVPGARDVRDSLGTRTTKIQVHIDRDRAALSGLDEESLQNLVSLAYGGFTATEIREVDRQTPVVVRLPQSLRDTPDVLRALEIRNASGLNVPLGEVTTISPATQTSASTLRDGLRTVVVLAQVKDRLPSAVLADFQHRIADLAIPSNVHIEYAGEDAQIRTSFKNLALALLIGLIINQVILLWEFGTIRLSLVVVAAIPLAFVGAIVGLVITGNHFGFVAAVGIASLGGIVTNHTIVLFEYAKRELEHGLPMEEALIAAGSKRLRPILLTVVASIAGLLPLAFSSQTLWQPFCWALIFGLGSSMITTLIAMPAIYRLAYRQRATRAIIAPALPEAERA